VKAEEIDVSQLASITTGFSGAQLKNVINQAAIIASYRGFETVTEKHLEEAFSDVLVGIKRPLKMDFEAKKLTAFHEGGHAIVSYFTPEAGKIYQATILPRGDSLGHVQQLPSRELSITRAQLFARLDVSYGGRIAEEMIFGVDNTTTGLWVDS